MDLVDDNGTTSPEDPAQSKAFFEDPMYIHYVGMLVPPRPGVVDCISLVENTHYTPKTFRNKLFHMRVLEWKGMAWAIVSIPYSDKEHMDRAAEANGLTIVLGTPHILCANGVSAFPVKNDRVHTFENKPGHPVYRKRR